MWSRLARPGRVLVALVVARAPQKLASRKVFGMVPPNQYDIPIPQKLHISYALKEYWETIPLFITTLFSIGILFIAIIWACKNKVDVVYTTHNRCNISRTMDLRNPSIHKMMIVNQRYEPWPEMADVYDKMTAAEKRALVRAQSCSLPGRAGAPLAAAARGPQILASRELFKMVPRSQYDIPMPKNLQLRHVVKEHWEIVPLFISTAFAFGLMFISIIWAFKNKVDVVYTTHNRCNISGTMDLRNPSIHKMMIINQRYEPWPEIADVYDKMTEAAENNYNSG